jgi:EVE domain
LAGTLIVAHRKRNISSQARSQLLPCPGDNNLLKSARLGEPTSPMTNVVSTTWWDVTLLLATTLYSRAWCNVWSRSSDTALDPRKCRLGQLRSEGASNRVRAGSGDSGSITFWGMASRPIRHWVIVVSREHARRGAAGGFVMANHGKRAPLTRLSRGDGILIYSPTTAYPDGEPLRAVTVVGDVTGDEPEPSDVMAGGFWRAANLREIQPLPLEQIRAHLPVSRLRFGFFELAAADADAILALASPMLH